MPDKLENIERWSSSVRMSYQKGRRRLSIWKDNPQEIYEIVSQDIYGKVLLLWELRSADVLRLP